jgi:valyl-tRNA synthetase
MSKSKGNVINPMETVAAFGSDALRMGIVANRSAGQNQAFSTDKVVAGRNFCNKLWNISRFIEDRLGDGYRDAMPVPTSLADHWIISELNDAIVDVEQKIEDYRFAEASETVYHVIWDSVADWFIESSKLEDNPSMLAWVLDVCLKLAHPFTPFVTETIWQTLPWHNNLLITAKWPEKTEFNAIAAGEFNQLKKLIAETRFVMSELPGNEKYDLLYQTDNLIADNIALIQRLAKLKGIKSVDQARGLRLAASGREAWLDVSERTLREHQENLEVRIAEVYSDIKALEARVSNDAYIAKAPAKLVEETRTQLEQKKTIVEHLKSELNILK